MNNTGTYSIGLITSITVLAVLHHMFVYYMASLVLFPVSIAWFLASISPMPVVVMGIFSIILELVSSLPFGTMIGVISLPTVSKYITHTNTDFTWKYFLELLIGISISITAIIFIKNGFHLTPFSSIPFTIAGLQIICTTISTFIVSILFHEYTSRP